MSLYNEVLRSNAPIRKTYSEFFGDYADLNNYLPPSQQAIRNYQLSRLELFQKIAIKDAEKTQQINKFLQSAGRFNRGNEFDKIIEKAIDQIYNNILPDIRTSGALSQKKLIANNALRKRTIERLSQLEILLKQLQNNTGEPISGTYINQLYSLFQEVPGTTVEEVMKNFFLLQGELLEELGTKWFNDRIPKNIQAKAISTGQLNISKKGQYISDMIVLNMDEINVQDSIEISFKIGQNGENKTLPLKNFLSLLESYTGTKQIILQDSELDKITQFVVMGIQAKSGARQKPWNVRSKNTWVSIRDFKVDSIIYVFQRLDDLRRSWDQNNKQMKIQSPAYQAFADYGVASVLDKILHLSQSDNQYLLTPNGFITYAERILEMYKGEKYSFTMKQVKLDDNLFRKKPVDLV